MRTRGDCHSRVTRTTHVRDRARRARRYAHASRAARRSTRAHACARARFARVARARTLALTRCTRVRERNFLTAISVGHRRAPLRFVSTLFSSPDDARRVRASPSSRGRAGRGDRAVAVHGGVECGEKWRGGGGLVSCPQVWRTAARPDRSDWPTDGMRGGRAWRHSGRRLCHCCGNTWGSGTSRRGSSPFVVTVSMARRPTRGSESLLSVVGDATLPVDDPRHAERAVRRAVHGARRGRDEAARRAAAAGAPTRRRRSTGAGARPPRAPKIGRLVPHYTFDTFVVGAANEVAFQAAQAVSAAPGQALQSGVPARRRRPRQDASDQRHRATSCCAGARGCRSRACRPSRS